jgi:hypothetical protein
MLNCIFKLGYDERKHTTVIPSINVAKDGFWVDVDGVYDPINGDYWVPPTQVLTVYKT